MSSTPQPSKKQKVSTPTTQPPTSDKKSAPKPSTPKANPSTAVTPNNKATPKSTPTNNNQNSTPKPTKTPTTSLNSVPQTKAQSVTSTPQKSTPKNTPKRKREEEVPTPIKEVPPPVEAEEEELNGVEKQEEQEEEQGHVVTEEARSSTVFVGSLPLDCTEAALKQHFSKCGSITLVHLLDKRAKATNTSPFAYVQFAKPEFATKAIETLNDSTLLGSLIRVQPAKVSTTTSLLRFAKIPADANGFDVRNALESLGGLCAHIVSVRVPGLPQDRSQKQGVAYVHWDSKETATKAKNEFNGKIKGVTPEITYAKVRDNRPTEGARGGGARGGARGGRGGRPV